MADQTTNTLPTRDELAAAMPMSCRDLPADAGEVVAAIRSESGKLTMAALAGARRGPARTFLVVKMSTISAERWARLDDEPFTFGSGVTGQHEATGYRVEDGVLRSQRKWVARVVDATVPKAEYAFLDRATGGGFIAPPDLTAGDVLVFGYEDKKGRKQQDFRVVTEATSERVAVLVAYDYAAARRLAREVVAATRTPVAADAPVDPRFAGVSDADLLAEVRRRGLV